MAVNYPGEVDSFDEPSLPEYTSLSSAGTGTRAHVEHHHDLGQAVIALEENAAFYDHDHSGEGGTAHGNKLAQADTHESPDTNLATTSIHHTLGTGPLQAAPGNHIHSYNSLLHRPYIVCTTATRPAEPFTGMMIYETDTNTVRVWAEWPTNPEATGVTGTDNFHRTSNTDLGSTWWEQHYLHDSGYGRFCTPYGIAAWWLPALTTSNWCIAHRIFDDDRYTHGDDQEIEVHHGDHDFDHHHEFGEEAPCNDHYFRMNDARTHYVRLALHHHWAVLYYTVNGYENEVVLGTLFLPAWEANLIWTFRVIDWEWHIYRNGIHCGSIVDVDHRHYRDSDHRGWGIGCHVVGHSGGQWRPPDVAECRINDVVSYNPTARWGLLPVASIPVLVAETRARQEILPGMHHICHWTHCLQEWWWAPFFHWHPDHLSMVNDTDITVHEPGVYHVHASICWDPGYTFHDHSMVGITVNGADISRKNWEFIRGFNYSPGFAQTNEINFWWRFNAGDVLRVVARHNASVPCWLWWHDTDPDRQVCHLELSYHSP